MGLSPKDKAAADKATADKATADKATADKAAADKAAADKAAADKATADKAAADKAAADKATADKAAAEKAAAEKAAARKTKLSDARSRLASFLPAPIDSIINSSMSDSERTRVLLVTVSRQLFVALAVSISLGFIIVITLQNFGGSEHVTLPIVMLCGIVGGFVGIQRRLKDLTMHDLELLADSRIYLILSPFVGGVLSLVLYLLFISQLLQGDLFPRFVADSKTPVLTKGFFLIADQHAKGGFSGYAKLMFWCFLAGFSEKFVTDVIGKFEGNAVKTIK